MGIRWKCCWLPIIILLMLGGCSGMGSSGTPTDPHAPGTGMRTDDESVRFFTEPERLEKEAAGKPEFREDGPHVERAAANDEPAGGAYAATESSTTERATRAPRQTAGERPRKRDYAEFEDWQRYQRWREEKRGTAEYRRFQEWRKWQDYRQWRQAND